MSATRKRGRVRRWLLLIVWVRGGPSLCCTAVARAAQGQNAVGSCVHSAANYTHRGASWRRHETIWQTGRRRHSEGMNTAREAKKYTESEPNYICLYLLPGATAASQRPCVKGGEATPCFVFLSVVVLQFNYRAPGSSCWGRGCI